MNERFAQIVLSADQLRLLDLSGIALHPRFQGFHVFSAEDHERIFRGDLIAMLDAGGFCHGYVDAGRTVGICAIAPLAWDSEHFGLPMARLMVAAMPGIDQGRLARSIGDSLLECARLHGSRHFSVDLDIDDYLCLNALLARGFEILDIKRTYRGHRFREDFMPPRLRSFVRAYEPGDFGDVMRLVGEADIASRFTRDRFLSNEKARDLYEQWFVKLLAAHESTSIARVYEKGGRAVACGVIGEFDFSPYGIDLKIMADGLYASGMAGVGAYLPIIHDLTVSSFERRGLVQTTISMNNRSAVKVLDSLRYHGGTVIRYALRLFLEPV